MADNKNLTIWQKLGILFGPDKSPILNQSRSYQIDSKELLKTKSKEEYNVEKLQAQQSLYLKNQWEKVDNTLYQQAVFYETTRIASYTDFESMEFFPEISAALDILMEESTTQDSKGKVLQIYSESDRVKRVLNDLFFNRLDIHTTLPMWTRNTPVREDSMIPLLDGTETTIKDLSTRIKNGEEIWTYSIQDGTKSIVPGKIIWCDLTRKDSELIRVILDDGTHIDTTPDHEYMLRDGSYKRADELSEGQSLMPFYTRKSDKKQDRIVGYEKVYNPNTGKYKFTHTLVSHECVRDLEYERLIGEQFDTHHKDFNKLNNEPKNLERLTHSNHFKLHAEHFYKILGTPEIIKKRMEGIDKYLRSDKRRKRLSKEMMGIYPKYFEEYNNSDLHIEHNKIRSEKMTSAWSSEGYKENTRNKMTITISDECLIYIKNLIKNSNEYIGINKLSKILKDDENFFKIFKKDFKLNKDPKKSFNATTLNKTIKRKTGLNYFDFIIGVKPELINDKTYLKSKSIFLGKTRKKLLNHKVVSVIKLDETSDVYCMEVVGPNGENDRHNFPICGKNEEGLYSRNGTFLSNCKYGDNFVFLDIDDKEGIVNCKQLPNIEIERHEGDVYNSINGVIDVERNKKKGDDLKFVWKNREFEFNSWQIAHFRLLGDDRRLPYGTSVLEKARRIYKQLMLSEDAMLIYRITRAPERRIFKIFVGNIDDKDVEPYVQQIANKFKRTPVVDPKTGQIDLRYNQMSNDQDFFIPVRDPAAGSPIETLPGACISLDTRIPLLDGRTLTLNEIIGEWDNGNRNLWVYSCNPKTGEFVPGMITWAGVTRKNTDVMKITLDNGEEIIATPDHKFLHREGYKIECKDLEVGMSLMPFYRKNEVKYQKNGYKKEYEMIFDHSINDWVWTHKKVSNFHKSNLSKEYVFNESKTNSNKNTIHHVDFNRFNNTPTNLVFMNFNDHLELHGKNTHIMREAFIKKYNENPTFRDKVKNNLDKGREIFHNKRNSNPEYKELIRTKQKEGVNNFFNSLSVEELKQWCERINNPTTKAKTTEKLLKWCENPDNLKLKGQLISVVKSTPEAKEKISNMSKSLWERPGYKESVFNKKQTLTFSDKLYNMFVNEFEKHLRADITLNILNNNSEFMSEFTLINGGIRSSLTNLDTFTHNHLEKMVKQKGFKNFREWKQNEITKRGFINIRQWQYYVDKEKGKYGDKNKGKSINQFYNHKIVKIEYLEEKIDTGTITVDGNEIYHNYHTFALESGIYILNSNLSEIADIEYLQKKLFAALRIPKPFLGFESAVGDGKNLALQDIRFTRTVNRIQQSMLQELNKIAIIHLFILGLDEELNNFTLALNNPSTQAEVLRTEHLQAKMQLYKDSVADAGNGFAAMSMTRAKKEILNFSNEEIRLDIEQQRLEKAAAAELANTANVIKKTGMFDKVDRIYGETTPTPVAEGGEVIPPASTEGGSESPEMGGGIETTPPETTETTPPTTESVDKKVENLLVERKEILTKTYDAKKERYKVNYLNKLMESLENNDKVKLIVNENDENVSDLNRKYNDDIKNMMNNIDNLLK